MEYIELIKSVAWPVAIIIAAVLVFLLIKRGRVQSLGLSKDGGLSLALAPIERRDEARYFMDRRIQEIDADLKVETREITQALRKPILAAVAGSGLCTAALRALASDLRGPMYHALDENDFKHRLTISRRAEYIRVKLAEMQQEYADLVEEASCDPCAAGPSATITFPTWGVVQPRLERAIGAWADRITAAVVGACRKKVDVYEEYLPQFQVADDSRFIEIVKGCIAKNRGYIEGLTGETEEMTA